MVRITLYPRMAAMYDRPTPVLPLVGSMTVSGLRMPFSSRVQNHASKPPGPWRS